MKDYIKLLSNQKILRKLSLVQLISYFGAWFSNVAIYTLLIELKVDATVIAFVAMLHFLSGVIQAPFSGALIDKLHPKRVMLVLLFLCSFFIFTSIEIHTAPSAPTQNLWQMMYATLKYLKKEPKVLHLMLVHAFVGFTAFDALVALLAKNYYAKIIAVSLALGLLHSFRALGLVLGPIILGKWIHKRNLIKLFCFEAAAIALWGMVMHSFYLSLIASIAVGFFTTTLWSYSYTLIQKNTDEKFYGRIVAYNDMLFLSVSAVTSYMTGVFAKQGMELESIAHILALTFLIGAIYYYAVLKKYEVLNDI